MLLLKYNTDGTLKSSFDKFFNEEQLKNLADSLQCKTWRSYFNISRQRRTHQKSNQRSAFVHG
ncbi:MAG: hypothetical protein WKF59_06315 [Chitinophagaceae bacterium]